MLSEILLSSSQSPWSSQKPKHNSLLDETNLFNVGSPLLESGNEHNSKPFSMEEVAQSPLVQNQIDTQNLEAFDLSTFHHAQRAYVANMNLPVAIYSTQQHNV